MFINYKIMEANGKITIEVSSLEAALIKRLRKFEFGTLTIHKIKGEPRRIEVGTSEMLSDKEGSTLAL